MKKLLSLILALTAVTSFCLVGCVNGKCDECGTEKLVEVYDKLDGEYCPLCAAEVAAEKAVEAWED